MYSVGSLLFYSRRGVYEVEHVGPGPLDDGQSYYKLRSAFSTSSETIYIPLDSDALVRPLIGSDEAEQLLELAAQLQPQVFSSSKSMELSAHYRSMLASCKPEDCLLLLKEISAKQRGLAGRSKKLGQVDQQYLKLAERLLCEELAAVLHTTPEGAKKELYAAMRRKAAVS